MNTKDIMRRLTNSKFRSQFHLTKKEISYIEKLGFEKIEEHARDFVDKRLMPAFPLHDGKQTPYHGHPVFLAQHATATCCRGCLEKWYQIPKGRELTSEEVEIIVWMIMKWIKNQYFIMEKNKVIN